MKSFLVLAAFLLGGMGPAIAGPAVTLQDLKFLQGTWRLEHPANEREEAFRLRYHFISRDSALVEVHGDPQKQATQTVIHADRDRLMATHYCARGNQPRLIATEKRGDRIEFRFLDVTNLASPDEPHMVRMAFTRIDDTRIRKEEVYRVDGREEASTMSLVGTD